MDELQKMRALLAAVLVVGFNTIQAGSDRTRSDRDAEAVDRALAQVDKILDECGIVHEDV